MGRPSENTTTECCGLVPSFGQLHFLPLPPPPPPPRPRPRAAALLGVPLAQDPHQVLAHVERPLGGAGVHLQIPH